jgi:hypothetical protein
MPVWLKEKLLLKNVLKDELVSLDGVKNQIFRRCFLENTMNLTLRPHFIRRLLSPRRSCVWTAWENGPRPLLGWATVTR